MQGRGRGRGRPKKQKMEHLDEEGNLVIQPRKRGRPKKQKRKVGRPKKQKIEDHNLSHSESQSWSSWECPVSARKRLPPNSNVISDRRDFRFSKRLIETELRCSKPKISREQSSSSDSIQQLDVPANTINSAYHVEEEGCDQVQSPSRDLVQVAHPLTLEPDLGQKEAENVENLTAGIPEMPLSNNSNQIDGQNTIEEIIPHEKEPLAEETQASNRFEEVTNMMSISRAGSSSPSFSLLKFTEVVAMLRNDDGDDEVDSEIQSQPEDTVYGYEVKPEFMPTLRKIIGKHGDIAKNCVTKSVKDRSKLLEIICGILHDFGDKDHKKIEKSFVESKIALVNGYEQGMQLDLKWLRMSLAEVIDAIKILDKFDILEEKRDNNSKLIEDAESELEVFEEQKKVVTEKMKELSEKMRELSENLEEICVKETACKERLTAAKNEFTSISQTVQYCTSKVSRFLKRSVMDGLI